MLPCSKDVQPSYLQAWAIVHFTVGSYCQNNPLLLSPGRMKEQIMKQP